HHRGHLLDGRHALSAAAVRLSLRGRGWLPAVRDVQGDGTAVAEGDHQSGDDRDLARRALPGLGRSLALHELVDLRKTCPGAGAFWCARVFCPLGERFCRGPESALTEILSFNQRDTDRP